MTTIPVYQATQFSISRDGAKRVFVAEASDLQYNCEEQIEIRNPRTGNGCVFRVTDRDVREGEVCGWWLTPTPDACRRFPDAASSRVLIIND